MRCAGDSRAEQHLSLPDTQPRKVPVTGRARAAEQELTEVTAGEGG